MSDVPGARDVGPAFAMRSSSRICVGTGIRPALIATRVTRARLRRGGSGAGGVSQDAPHRRAVSINNRSAFSFKWNRISFKFESNAFRRKNGGAPPAHVVRDVIWSSRPPLRYARACRGHPGKGRKVALPSGMGRDKPGHDGIGDSRKALN